MTEDFSLTPRMGFLKAVQGQEWMSRNLGLLFFCRVFYFPLEEEEATSLVKMTITLFHPLPIPSQPNISHVSPSGLKSKGLNTESIQSFYCIHVPGWQMGEIVRDAN